MIQYVYSVTIIKENDSLAFLKAFDKKIIATVQGDGASKRGVVDRDHPTGFWTDGVDTQTFGYVGVVYATDAEDLRRQMRQITEKYELSMEYVHDGWVWLLPYKQLHSGPDFKYNQVIKHRDVPRVRSRKKKEHDVQLRPAEPRDYGQIEGDESDIPAQTIAELLKEKKWISRWAARYVWLVQEYTKDRCPCHEIKINRELFLHAFVLTVADIHMWRGDEIPHEAWHCRIWNSGTDQIKPLIFSYGLTLIDSSSPHYMIYIKPTLEGRSWDTMPGGIFYSWERPYELSEIYYDAIKEFGKYYAIP